MKNVWIILAAIVMFACDSESDPAPVTPPVVPEPEVPVVVIQKLTTIKKDGAVWREFFYDTEKRLTSYKTHDNAPGHYEFKYTFHENGRVKDVQKLLDGVTLNATIVYTYVSDTKLEKLEYYAANETLYNTATYTYTNDLLTNIDNSDKSVQGLHYRNFEYNGHEVSKISFDFGNAWNYEYFADKTIEAPLAFDLSDPRNQMDHPVSTFTYVAYSSYTATYEFDDKSRVIKETRNYPNRPAGDPDYLQTEVYTYEYQ